MCVAFPGGHLPQDATNEFFLIGRKTLVMVLHEALQTAMNLHQRNIVNIPIMMLLLSAILVGCNVRQFFKNAEFGFTCRVKKPENPTLRPGKPTLTIPEPSQTGLPDFEFSCGPMVRFLLAGSTVIGLEEARLAVAAKLEQQRQIVAALGRTLKETQEAATEVALALSERARGSRPLDDRQREMMNEQRSKLVDELQSLEIQKATASKELSLLEADAQTVNSLSLPSDAITLTRGTWEQKDDGYVFRATGPYRPGLKVVIPYAVRDSQGHIQQVDSITADRIEQGNPPRE